MSWSSRAKLRDVRMERWRVLFTRKSPYSAHNQIITFSSGTPVEQTETAWLIHHPRKTLSTTEKTTSLEQTFSLESKLVTDGNQTANVPRLRQTFNEKVNLIKKKKLILTSWVKTYETSVCRTLIKSELRGRHLALLGVTYLRGLGALCGKVEEARRAKKKKKKCFPFSGEFAKTNGKETVAKWIFQHREPLI